MARLRPSPTSSSLHVPRSLVSIVLVAFVCAAMIVTPRSALAQGGCRLDQRFVALRDQVPEIVGECVETARTNAANGNVEQRTTKGELVWRKADSRAVFTNGSLTWIIGPNGLQSRSNSTTFDWESIPVARQQEPSANGPSQPATAAPSPTANPSVSEIVDGVLTNAHVVKGTKAIQLLFSDGAKQKGRLEVVDELRDVALVSSPTAAPFIGVERNDEQRVGDEVLVLGCPRPDVIGIKEITVTRGSISAIRQRRGVTYIQTDALMEPGNSGGPVVNMRGKLIGLATWDVSGSPGLNFAVSADEVIAAITSPGSNAESQAQDSGTEDQQADEPDVSDALKMKCLDVSAKQSRTLAKSAGLDKDEAAELLLSLTEACIQIAQLDGQAGVVCHEKALNALIADPPRSPSAFRTRYNRQYQGCMKA